MDEQQEIEQVGDQHGQELVALEERQEALDQQALTEAQAESRTEIAAPGDELSDDQVQEVFGNINDGLEADRLMGEWGVNAGANLQKVWRFAEANPGLVEALEPIGADAALLRAGLLMAEQWERAQPSKKGKGKMNAPPENLSQKLSRLTEEQAIAMARNDHEKAMELDKQIEAVAIQISGDQPIVGGFGPDGTSNV